MNLVKQRMPQHGGSEGVWEGVYIYTDAEGKELIRHSSRLTHVFPDDKPEEYHQTNEYTWPNGKEDKYFYVFKLDGDELSWTHEASDGAVWEEPLRVGDMPTVRVSWFRKRVEPEMPYDVSNATIHELIEMDRDYKHRARVWQWFHEGELIGRTIIKERRVA